MQPYETAEKVLFQLAYKTGTVILATLASCLPFARNPHQIPSLGSNCSGAQSIQHSAAHHFFIRSFKMV